MSHERDPKFIALTAQMEDKAVVARNIGRKVKVSEMELIILCTFAELSMLSLYSSLDGEVGEKARVKFDRLIEAIRSTYQKNGDRKGLQRLSSSCAALLRSDRFFGYITEHEEDAS